MTPLFLLPTGFWHEQSRADRDKNVEIVWNNINPAMKYNFMKYTLTQIQHLNAPYDTCSVMHYSGTAFSRVNLDKRKFRTIYLNSESSEQFLVQVNLFQKLSFLNHLNHNMTTDCSLIPDFITRKIQVQNMLCTKIVFCFGIQNNFCTQHVLNLYFSG